MKRQSTEKKDQRIQSVESIHNYIMAATEQKKSNSRVLLWFRQVVPGSLSIRWPYNLLHLFLQDGKPYKNI